MNFLLYSEGLSHSLRFEQSAPSPIFVQQKLIEATLLQSFEILKKCCRKQMKKETLATVFFPKNI